MIIDEYKAPKIHCINHIFKVPLDYFDPDSETIEVFAREVRSISKADKKRPYLVYFQGGPGYDSPRPTSVSGWVREALKEFHVLLLDQRGTGLSTPFNLNSMKKFSTDEEVAKYLTNLRADNIVRDAEVIRKELIGDGKWSILG